MITTFFSLFFGLLIGSFLSVCIYRIPLGRGSGLEELDPEEGEEDGEQAEQVEANQESQRNSPYFKKKVTISYPPRSFCPSCGKDIKWFHNIPLFSWIFLRGKCANCKSTISVRYPFVETLSAALCYFAFSQFDPATASLVYALACMLIVISFIDIDYFIIPNVITYPGTILGFAVAALNDFTGWFQSPIAPGVLSAFLGVLVGSGFLLLISEGYLRLRKKQGLGMGDVKLLAVLGAFLGPEAAFYTIFVGSLLGTVLGVGMLIVGRNKLNQYLPFGPSLAIAGLLYLYTGPLVLIEITRFLGSGLQTLFN